MKKELKDYYIFSKKVNLEMAFFSISDLHSDKQLQSSVVVVVAAGVTKNKCFKGSLRLLLDNYPTIKN